MTGLASLIAQHGSDLSGLIGLAGALLYVGGCFLVQNGFIPGFGLAYTLLIVTASSCVLVSLFDEFNMAAFVIQVSFLAIGLCRLLRWMVLRWRARSEGSRHSLPVAAQSGLK